MNNLKQKFPIVIDDWCGAFHIMIGKCGWFNFELGKSFKHGIIITRKDTLLTLKEAINKSLEIMENYERKNQRKSK